MARGRKRQRKTMGTKKNGTEGDDDADVTLEEKCALITDEVIVGGSEGQGEANDENKIQKGGKGSSGRRKLNLLQRKWGEIGKVKWINRENNLY